MKLPVLLAAALLLASTASTAADGDLPLAERSNKYEIEWNGIGLGVGTISLAREPDGCYLFTSTTDPIALVRWTYGSPREQSRFCVSDGQLLAQQFEYSIEKRSKEGFRLDFDWAAKKVRTLKGGVVTDREVPQPAYDRFLIREAVRLWVIQQQAGKAPAEAEFTMVDDDRIKAYRFAVVGAETIDTPTGKIETIRVDRTDSAKRPSHYWLAPSLDYVPVKIEQLKKDKVELRMLLVK
ncbi:MAG TPA: DUF3108 domain-containing protein [Fontimonas sp.]